MGNKERILFLYGTAKSKSNAYSFRLDKFRDYLSKKNYNVQSIYLNDSYLPVPCLFQPLNIPFFLKELRKSDIVHAGNTPCAYLCKASQKVIEKKYIYDVHGSLIQENLLKFTKYDINAAYNLFQAKIMEHVARSSNYFITCSTPLKNYYADLGIEPHKIEIIRNGVDLDLFKPIRCDLGNEEFTITYAGGFQKWQGIENLIAAARLVNRYNIKFKIIGFTPKDQSLKEKIRSELRDSVYLIDSLKREELIKHLSSSNLLVIPRNRHPAIKYAFPTKFAEYISIEKPIIVTDVDETAEFVRKYECGFACEPNPESIAESIITASNLSELSLNKMGRNGRKLAEKKFDQNIINDKYLNFVSKILDETI